MGELAAWEEHGAVDIHPWIAEAVSPGGDGEAVGSGDDGEAVSPGGHGEVAVTGVRMPGSPSRWSSGRSTDWVPLRPELVAEVTYENLTNGRFRHPARMLRSAGADKSAAECTYEQVEQPPPIKLTEIFSPTG